MESRNLMDFDIGNLFYIIAMIVAVLVGVLGKKNKPKRGPQIPGASSGGKTNFFDLLGKELQGFVEPDQPEQEISMEEQPEQVFMEYEEEPEPVKEEESEIYRRFEERMNSPMGAEYRDLTQYEGISSTGEIQVIELEDEEGVDYFDVLRNFDLETAVIYSAVINRNEY